MTIGLYIIQLVSTLFMTGIIWFVQVVHYPLFLVVGENQLFYLGHQKRISRVVIPAMLIEAFTVLYLAIFQSSFLNWLSFFFLLVIWLSTFTFQVPCHQFLVLKFDKNIVSRLISTNWIRIVFWSFRSLLILFIFYKKGCFL